MGKKLTQKEKHQLELGWMYYKEDMEKYEKDISDLCKRHHLYYAVEMNPWEENVTWYLNSLKGSKVLVNAECRNFYELVGYVRGLLHGAYKIETQHVWGDGIPETGEMIKDIEKPDYSYLIDKPVHIMENGSIKKQGSIVSVDHDAGVFNIQLYSFVDGEPTSLEDVPIDDFQDWDKCRVYSNDDAWHKAFCEQLQEEGLLTGSVDYNVSLMGERVRDK